MVNNATNINKQHGGCIIRGRNCLKVASIWVHTQFMVGSALFPLSVIFCVVVLCLCMDNVVIVSGLSIRFFSDVYTQEDEFIVKCKNKYSKWTSKWWIYVFLYNACNMTQYLSARKQKTIDYTTQINDVCVLLQVTWSFQLRINQSLIIHGKCDTQFC